MFDDQYVYPIKGYSPNDIFFKHYAKQAFSETDILAIKKYLFEKDCFFHYEFSLFNNYLSYFDHEFVIVTLPTVNKYLDTVDEILDYRLERLTFYINLGYYFFYHDTVPELKKLKPKMTDLVTKYYLQISLEQLYKYHLLIDLIENHFTPEKYEKFNEIGLTKLLDQVKEKVQSLSSLSILSQADQKS